MSLFEDSSLIVTPNGRKAGKIHALKPFNGRGDLTVVRATTKTEVNASGVIVYVPINVPSFDYTNGSCPSILVEPQRTNLVFPSATATTQSRTVTAVAHTLSFYGTGSITLSDVATGTLVGTGVSNRVTLTFTPTAGSLTLTVTGSVTDWQLEAGANATSLIKTTVSAVTRNADVISKTGLSSLINSQEGILFFNLKPLLPIPSLGMGYSLSNGTNSELIYMAFTSTSNRLLMSIVNSNGVNLNVNIDGVNFSIFNKIAIKWKQNELKVFINSVNIYTNLSFNTFSVNSLSVIKFSRADNARFLEGNVKNVLVFPTALTDEQCISLTT